MEEQIERPNVCWRTRQRFLELNLFETDAIDQETVSIQRWSTRIYLLLLIIGILILLIYNGIRMETRQLEVSNPTLETYMKLQEVYGAEVKCPCTQRSVRTISFVKLIIEYHEICTSQLVSQEWIDLLFDNTTYMRFVMDFRATATHQFQVLRELCILAQKIINSNKQLFYTENLISGYLFSAKLFQAEVETMIKSFQVNTIAFSLRYISFYRFFTMGNATMTGIQAPFTLLPYTNDGILYFVNAQLNYYVGLKDMKYCTCNVNAICHLPARFFDVESIYDDGEIDGSAFNASFTPDKWFMDCWPLEALLLSSWKNNFLTNQSALNMLTTHVELTSNWTPIALNESNIKNESNTFEDLLQTLFVNHWSSQFNYSSYFSQCLPQVCTYTITQRSNFLYMFTALLGLYGGLSVVLHFLVPYMVCFLSRLLKRLSPRDSSNDSNTDNNGNLLSFILLFKIRLCITL